MLWGNKRMRAALIDGAVNLKFMESIQNPNVRMQGAYTVRDGKVTKESASAEGITHASVCAGIFLSEVQVPCELWCICVLKEHSLQGDIASLLTALDFCRKQRMDVVSLSVGTTCIRDGGKLEPKIRELADSGAIIVAAESNRRMLTFPAAMDQVIGVREDTLSNRRDFSNAILYRSRKRVFTYKGQSVVTGVYNSYAAPAVTAEVCGYLSGGITGTEQIRQRLKRLRNVREGGSVRGGTLDKPVIFLDIRENEKAVLCMEKILDYFEQHEYEGVCISDTLRTDYAAGRLSIWQFAQGARGFKNRLISLTRAVNADFVIWHVAGQKTGRLCLREADLVVTDRTEQWRGWKKKKIFNTLDGEALDRMRVYLE